MEKLSNEKLIDAYLRAVKHGLDKDFIEILKKEIEIRGLKMNELEAMEKELV